MLNGVKLIAEVPSSWNRGFDSEVIILQKQRFCSDCYNCSMLSQSDQSTQSMCDKCDNILNRTKEF